MIDSCKSISAIFPLDSKFVVCVHVFTCHLLLQLPFLPDFYSYLFLPDFYSYFFTWLLRLPFFTWLLQLPVFSWLLQLPFLPDFYSYLFWPDFYSYLFLPDFYSCLFLPDFYRTGASDRRWEPGPWIGGEDGPPDPNGEKDPTGECRSPSYSPVGVPWENETLKSSVMFNNYICKSQISNMWRSSRLLPVICDVLQLQIQVTNLL